MAFSAASFALQVGGMIASHNQNRANIKAQNTYNQQTAIAQQQHRVEVLRFQNDTWKQDLDFAFEQLGYSRREFDRQAEWVEKAQAAVTANRDAEAFTLMLRGIEENIAVQLGGQQTAATGRAARARISATERGVEGNTVDQVLGEVSRQEGEANVIAELNRSAGMRQLEREARSLDANADQQLAQIAGSVRTLSPQAPVRLPQPINPLAPNAPTPVPTGSGLGVGLARAGVDAFNTYNNLSGSKPNETLSALSGWVRRQFSFGE
jgi:hypothetical protein